MIPKPKNPFFNSLYKRILEKKADDLRTEAGDKWRLAEKVRLHYSPEIKQTLPPRAEIDPNFISYTASGKQKAKPPKNFEKWIKFVKKVRTVDPHVSPKVLGEMWRRCH